MINSNLIPVISFCVAACMASHACATPLEDEIAKAGADEIAEITNNLQIGTQANSKLTNAALIAKVKKILLSELKDPESAKFRNVSVYRTAEARVVCGELNAKNSYGGYIGFVQFMADGGEVNIMAGEINGYSTALMVALTLAHMPNLSREYPNPAFKEFCQNK